MTQAGREARPYKDSFKVKEEAGIALTIPASS